MRTSIMKKKYIAPTAQSYELFWENGVALNILSTQGDPTLDDENEILSNKKDNPIWGESKSGMWDNMNK